MYIIDLSRLACTFPRRPQRGAVLLGVFAVVCVASSRAQGGGSPAPARAVQLPLSGNLPSGARIEQSVPIPSGTVIQVQVQTQGSFAGSVPGNDQAPTVISLTLADAVRRGLRTNLGLIAASNGELQARAQKDVVRSALLPNLNLSAAENIAKVNLAAEGFSASAFGAGLGFQFPSTVGPFHFYDVHATLQQSLIDVAAVRNLRTQRSVVEGARQQSLQAREEVVLAVAGVYLELLADEALLERQQAEVNLAQASYRQSRAQVDAGNKAELEANRSLVELQTEQQRLRAQEGQVQKRQMQLIRLIGLPLSARIKATDHLAALSLPIVAVEQLVQTAWQNRAELRSTEAQLRAAEEARKAASAERLPTIGAGGSFGLQGTNPNKGQGIYQAQVALNVPVFQGGRIQADIRQSDAVLAQRRAELANQRGEVELDVRTAYLDLQVATDQVALARSNRDLANRTLLQSQDRFAVGVADSVEVVNSQQALAGADHDLVSSLFAQTVARVSLAHAMGAGEATIPNLLEGSTK